MCGLKPCTPMHDGCTWSEAHRIACEARHILAMPLQERRDWLADLEIRRGDIESLKTEIRRQFTARKSETLKQRPDMALFKP